jgi:hypothetical protein
MRGVDAPQQLRLIEAETNRVIRLPFAGAPRRSLPPHDRRELVRICDHLTIDVLMEREQPGLMSQQLPHGRVLFADLSELGPIIGHALVVVEPAARMRQRKRHRREALARGVNDDHRVLLPEGAARRVANPAPEVDDFLALPIDAASCAELAAPREVLQKCRANRLVAATYRTFDVQRALHANGDTARIKPARAAAQ